MNKHVRYVPSAKFVSLLTDAGIQFSELAGFYAIEGKKLPGEKKSQYRIYVPRTKLVGQVDISGFEVEFGAVPNPVKNGRVLQILDMSTELSEDDILTNFSSLLAHMLALEPVVKEKKAPRPSSSPETQEAPADPEEAANLARAMDEAKAKRIALIKAYAEQNGLPISPSSIAAQADAE